MKIDAQVLALVGGQFGSEGKGVIAYHLANDFTVHVRTGGPNAGHTFVHEGRKWVARQLPIGWVNPDATLLIGPGAVVDVGLLEAEIAEVEAAGYDVRRRVMVDNKAHVIDPVAHHKFEGGVDGAAHQLIGSTGEGVGPARMAKIARRTFGQSPWAKATPVGQIETPLFPVGDTVQHVNYRIDQGAGVLLEGTQGSGLSITHGPWPYCTSHDTNAATLAADAGIAPQLVQTLLVVRTYPIRVAGNSGPLPEEVTWDELGLEPEYTTVTKKPRRIARFDFGTVEAAIRLNRPIGMALTFLDYWFPETQGATWETLPSKAKQRVTYLGQGLDCPVKLVSTGPAGTPIIEVPQYKLVAA